MKILVQQGLVEGRLVSLTANPLQKKREMNLEAIADYLQDGSSLISSFRGAYWIIKENRNANCAVAICKFTSTKQETDYFFAIKRANSK